MSAHLTFKNILNIAYLNLKMKVILHFEMKINSYTVLNNILLQTSPQLSCLGRFLPTKLELPLTQPPLQRQVRLLASRPRCVDAPSAAGRPAARRYTPRCRRPGHQAAGLQPHPKTDGRAGAQTSLRQGVSTERGRERGKRERENGCNLVNECEI